jgi:hypothetical protein
VARGRDLELEDSLVLSNNISVGVFAVYGKFAYILTNLIPESFIKWVFLSLF